MPMDDVDRRILALLQEDAALSVAEIGGRVGLSSTPCWRRIQNLEKQGIIRKRVALLDRRAVEVPLTVFVMIRTSQHNDEWLETFAKGVADIPEVLEFYRMSGTVDYLLRIVVPSVEAYDAVYKRLISIADLAEVSSSFAMEEIKYTTALPLTYAG
ncbi:Lrp/AsnC family transcriptional regulator [Nisaea acidiphila]|uniref:Lrp/AsnC family transcriptional regulator n=1 Tax=Nisaea acidiphila TaxID=1862145 RepID=A0A9J7AVY9_9PROT|nr:Lrp/AsnC family transcriptional regulator [Nisaea acidiphila]UUX51955.1 Lrp/AsnC family transcriptional regulator [Nisaea acidiphila]